MTRNLSPSVDPVGIKLGDFDLLLPDLPSGDGIEKQAKFGKPPRSGLVPKSGDWDYPYRWIRPREDKSKSPEHPNFSLSSQANNLVQILSEAGEPFFVGGMVRDVLLGRTDSKDVDIEIYGIPKDRLEGILVGLGETGTEVGKQFGVFKVGNVDISLPRKEIRTGLKHTDFAISSDPSMDKETAARRRDFTINALMYDVKNQKTLDFFGGIEDLKNRVIRHVDKATFVEDPLRVYRAAQFAARLNFDIASETIALAKKMDLSSLPPERIYEEFKKILLKSEIPSTGLQALDDMGVLERYYPEISILKDTPQSEKWHAEGDVFSHTKMALDEAAEIAKRFPKEQDRLAILFAVLAHDFGKATTGVKHPEKNIITHYGHEEAGEELARSFLSKLTTDKYVVETVAFLVSHHLLPAHFYRNQNPDKSFRRLINRYGIHKLRLLSAVSEADMLGRFHKTATEEIIPSRKEAIDWFNSKLDSVIQDIGITSTGKLIPLLSGTDLIRMGFEPGPAMGKMLADIQDKQEFGVLASKDDAVKYIQQQYGSAIEKQAEFGRPPREGLIPQSGDPYHPDRWIRPKAALAKKAKRISDFEALSWIKRQFGLDEEEINDALSIYCGPDGYSFEINFALRHKEGKMPEGFDLAPALRILDEYTSKFQAPENFIVYRGIPSKTAEGEPIDLSSLEVGAIVSDKGYMSTTTSLIDALFWADMSENTVVDQGFILELTIPKGQKMGVNPEEKEMILPRGTSVKIGKKKTIKTREGRSVSVITGELMQ